MGSNRRKCALGASLLVLSHFCHGKCLFFSLLLLGIPAEYVGNSATTFYLLYPMIWLLVNERWTIFGILSLLYWIVVYNDQREQALANTAISFGFLILMVAPGSILLWSVLQNERRLNADIKRAEEFLVETLATTVHDTALTSLTREVLRIRALALRVNDPECVAELRNIEEGLRRASDSLRSVFLMKESENFSAETVDGILEESQRMLQARNCQLEKNIEIDVSKKMKNDDLRFMLIVLREGLTNAAKYAERNTKVRVDISTSNNNIDLCISSVCGLEKRHAETLSSWQGIRSLTVRARELGIVFFAGQVGDMWLHSMSVPGQNDECFPEGLLPSKGLESHECE